MSTPKTADRARKMVTEIGSRRRATSVYPEGRKYNQERLETLLAGLNDSDRPKFDDITEGLIDSTLNPLLAQAPDCMSQGTDPK